MKKQLTNELLIALFSTFDCDGSGSITELNIIRAMSKIGKEITQEELDEVMRVHAKEGTISLIDFRALLLDIVVVEKGSPNAMDV